jgi:hypothetical protein
MSLIPTKQPRLMTPNEIITANKVFAGSINYSMVRITNALGFGGSFWVSPPGPGVPYYAVHMGNNYYSYPTPDSPALIHELTHVWQGLHGIPYMYVLNSGAHQGWSLATTGNTNQAYVYGNQSNQLQWYEYNVEQQAQIVQDWFRLGSSYGNRSSYDWRFRYIFSNIRTGNPYATSTQIWVPVAPPPQNFTIGSSTLFSRQ